MPPSISMNNFSTNLSHWPMRISMLIVLFFLRTCIVTDVVGSRDNIAWDGFFVQRIDVVTFFECISRPAKSPGISVSVHKWRATSRCPGNVKKCPGIEVILLISTCSYRKNFH